VRIIYNGLATVSDNTALLAHTEVMKPCDAPESTKMMIGRHSWVHDIDKHSARHVHNLNTGRCLLQSSAEVHEVIQAEEI
jgi:hypothetical protein